MTLLKKGHWWVWFLLSIVTCNVSILFLGSLLDVYEKGAWYTKWYYWVLGFVCGIMPGLVMFFIFNIKITIDVCKKLKVPGEEIYSLPYVWILCFIVPIIGWALFLVLLIYTRLWYFVKLGQGYGEKYIN